MEVEALLSTVAVIPAPVKFVPVLVPIGLVQAESLKRVMVAVSDEAPPIIRGVIELLEGEAGVALEWVGELGGRLS